ncbi:MAG TPA: 3-deoxy-D-manno-octulosonic acid transferase [Pyrinomonadaceae bacterium]|nr:3-deoxy-D-manno-octulosonic acid transferase [Pyrinomonadaceae bacterium]
MYQLYSLLLTLGFLVLLPRFLFDAFRHGKYIAGFRERLGSYPPTKVPQPVIWLHCVSVGETQAARPLVDLISKHFPGHALVVSTITLTGQNLARKVFRDKAARVFYFPFDWRWTVRRSLKEIRPAAVLLMETELWPNFLRQCSVEKIPVAMVNGRLSARSSRRYRLVRNFFRRVVADLRLAIMQTEADAERLKSLGFPDERVLVSGNLKFDAGTLTASTPLTETLGQRFDLIDNNLILAASTHAPEEQIILESFQLVRQKIIPTPRLMIAPRHPERFNEVASILQASGLSWKRRTEPETATDRECDVILLDTIGELTAAYPLSALVFVGGSIANFGGHNILEPAAVGSCIVTGANTHNFEAIVAAFVTAGAIIQLSRLTEREMVLKLARVMKDTLTDPQMRKLLGMRASRLVEENLGATERTLNLVKRFALIT